MYLRRSWNQFVARNADHHHLCFASANVTDYGTVILATLASQPENALASPPQMWLIAHAHRLATVSKLLKGFAARAVSSSPQRAAVKAVIT